jgi:DNA-binding MarR family transcriptional regulator
MDTAVDDAEVTRFLSAWFEVRQFIQAANFNHFHQAGLSATQFMILNVLPEDGRSLSIGELARRMNLKPATVAGTVDTLEQRGMLSRAKSTEDGRLVLVAVTAEGRKLQNAAAGQFRAKIAEVFRSIPDHDRHALIAGLESFVRALPEPTPYSRTPRASGEA